MHKPDWCGHTLGYCQSLTVSSLDRYLCEVEGPARGAPGADFVQDIVVVKGKDLVVEVSTRSRGIACKRSWRKMTLTRRKSCTCNGKISKHAAADGVATGPATPTSAESGASTVSTLPIPTKARTVLVYIPVLPSYNSI